jgi:hypothetical protein
MGYPIRRDHHSGAIICSGGGSGQRPFYLDLAKQADTKKEFEQLR